MVKTNTPEKASADQAKFLQLLTKKKLSKHNTKYPVSFHIQILLKKSKVFLKIFSQFF